MDKGTYRPRVIDSELAAALQAAGAVVVEGAKGCGKTTTAEQVAASAVHLDRDSAARASGMESPESLLPGEAPRLIDEWQLVPDVWNTVRSEVDQRGAPGQFILTGSATPAEDAMRHSGALRFMRLAMRPMSLLESGESTGDASLKAMWDGKVPPSALESLPLENVVDAACRGGWPSSLSLDLSAAMALNRSYLRIMAGVEIATVDGKKRDPLKVEALLSALGRNTATYVSNRVLQADSAEYGESIDPKTIASYLDALERLWVLAPQHAWGGHLQSSAAARKAPKRHLADPSLAVAAMEAEPQDLLEDRAALGQVFETLAFRDLSVYAQSMGAGVRAFQDKDGRELDAVVVKGVRWAGIEVKLSGTPAILDAAAANLTAIARRMRREPQFLAVVTASGPTYTRKDGVRVVSISQLGP
jgi:predicted AAA+ superfamily ATPase